jgi:hypothetical protein
MLPLPIRAATRVQNIFLLAGSSHRGIRNLEIVAVSSQIGLASDLGLPGSRR